MSEEFGVRESGRNAEQTDSSWNKEQMEIPSSFCLNIQINNILWWDEPIFLFIILWHYPEEWQWELCCMAEKNGRKVPILHRFASSVGKDYGLIAVHHDGSLGRMDFNFVCAHLRLTEDSQLTGRSLGDTKISHLPYRLLPWQQQASAALARHKCDCASNQSTGPIAQTLELVSLSSEMWNDCACIPVCRCVSVHQHSETMMFGQRPTKKSKWWDAFHCKFDNINVKGKPFTAICN